MTTFPFEVPRDRLEGDLDAFVDAIFSTLESEFLVLARGNGFVAYPVFESAYQALKQGSDGFRDLDPQRILDVVLETPLALVVLRTMLGFTPSEWAYLASRGSGITVTQGYARQLDRRVRVDAARLPHGNDRITALVRSACDLLSNGPPGVEPDRVHRLDKADTSHGLVSVRHLATMGAPYAMLLYERLLGRPFAGHRDSVSELIGGGLETAIEKDMKKLLLATDGKVFTWKTLDRLVACTNLSRYRLPPEPAG